MSRLDELLHAAIGEEFPGVEVGPDAGFFPHPRSEQGDFSSAAPQRIAAQMKLSAHLVAEKLSARMQRGLPAQWRQEAGFLIVQGAPSELWHDKVYSAPTLGALLNVTRSNREPYSGQNSGSNVTVVCIVPSGVVPEYASLRLVAVGALNALCCSAVDGESGFLLDRQAHESSEQAVGVCRVKGWQDLLTVVDCAFDFFLPTSDAQIEGGERASQRSKVGNDSGADSRSYFGAGQCELSDETLQIIEASTRGQVIVWSIHHALDRLGKRSKGVLSRARAERRVIVRMPNDGWLLTRERGLAEILSPRSLRTVVDRLFLSPADANESLARWVLHAASPAPSSEWDPAAACFDEVASPWWAITSLSARIDRLLPYTVKLRAAELSNSANLAKRDGPSGECSGSQLQSGAADFAVDDSGTTAEQFGRGPQVGVSRVLWLESVFLPYWIARGARWGDISELSAAIVAFTQRAHTVLNSPQLRSVLERNSVAGAESTDASEIGPLNSATREILAGLQFGLSSILPFVSKGERR